MLSSDGAECSRLCCFYGRDKSLGKRALRAPRKVRHAQQDAILQNRSMKQYVLLCCSCSILLHGVTGAQTITIRLLNAKSGKPITDQNVTLKWDKDFKSSKISTDDTGSGHVQVPQEAAQFVMIAGPKKGSEPERIPYRNCNASTPALISIDRVTTKGWVPNNVCGHAKATPHPGEVVFWALPLPWWKPDMQ